MGNQAYIFIVFILNGFLIGILFDVFRILRKSFKTKDIITYIEDIIFWIFTGLIIIYSLFKFNNGEVRGFIFVGIILGVLLYMLLFSKLFINIAFYLINFVKKIVYFIIIIPIKFLINLIRKILLKPISFIIINIRKSMSNFKLKIKRMYNKKKKIEYKKDFT